MASYTESLLQDKLREVKAVATAYTPWNAEKLRLPNSEFYNE